MLLEYQKKFKKSLREKHPNTELFLVRIQSKCGKIRTRNSSVFGHFSRSDILKKWQFFHKIFDKRHGNISKMKNIKNYGVAGFTGCLW